MRRIYKKKTLNKQGLTLKDWRNSKSCFYYFRFMNMFTNGYKITFRDVSYREKINIALQKKQFVKVGKSYHGLWRRIINYFLYYDSTFRKKRRKMFLTPDTQRLYAQDKFQPI